MDFRELQYVVTVADCRNITQAAKQLYISQPSLSYALARIEKEIGVKLFDRSQQPLALTDAGIIYVKTARDILQERIEMKNRLADLKDGQGHLAVGKAVSDYSAQPMDLPRPAVRGGEVLLLPAGYGLGTARQLRLRRGRHYNG